MFNVECWLLNVPTSVLIFAIALYRWTISPAARFLFGPDRRLPFHADLLAIRDGRDSCAGRAGRRLAGGQTDLPLPSVGRLRARSGAETRSRKSEVGIQNIIHGPHRHHRCHALRRSAGVWFVPSRNMPRSWPSRRQAPTRRSRLKLPMPPPRQRHRARRHRTRASAVPSGFPSTPTCRSKRSCSRNAHARYTFTSRGGGLKWSNCWITRKPFRALEDGNDHATAWPR